MRNTIPAALFCAALAATPSLGQAREDPRAFVGEYMNELGDYLVVDCDAPEACVYTLVKDDRLERLFARYGDSVGRIAFTGVIVEACRDWRSTRYACSTSKDGKAVAILWWTDSKAVD
jgi:hypothetical protein